MKTKHLLYAALILSAFLANQIVATGTSPYSTISLMPLPEYLARGPSKLIMDSAFSVYLSGYHDPRLQAAVSRFLHRLQKKTGISFALLPLADTKAVPAKLEIKCSGAGEKIQSPKADESYTMEVTSQNARLWASSPIGILRGLETFLQLVDSAEGTYFIPVVRIEDRPRFCWRGLLIDVSRH